MRRDNKEFKERFARWKNGEKVYEHGRPLPKYEDGKGEEEFYQRMQERQAQLNTPKLQYVRENGNPIAFDEQGNLIDQVTGQTGTMYQEGPVITPRRYDAYGSTYNSEDVLKGFNALTAGGLNNLSPTQWARRIYDLPKLATGDMNFSTYANRWLNGNEGIVSHNFEQNHPYWSFAFNAGGDALTGAAANKLQQLNKLNRLERWTTGIPHKVDRNTKEWMADLFRKGYNGTIWTSDNPDYGRYFADIDNGGTLFDIYIDPKKLNILETPKIENGYTLWNKLPFTAKRGRIILDDKAQLNPNINMYKTKDAFFKNKQDGLSSEYWNWPKEQTIHPIIDPKFNPPAGISKSGLKTDNIVKYSKKLKYDGTKFYNTYDGGLEYNGELYDIPINELILNPGSEYFWTEHGAGKLGLLNQMPYKNILPYTSIGSGANLTKTYAE